MASIQPAKMCPGLLETLGFLLFAAVLNAAYSPAAGLGVLVMAIVLQSPAMMEPELYVELVPTWQILRI